MLNSYSVNIQLILKFKYLISNMIIFKISTKFNIGSVILQ